MSITLDMFQTGAFGALIYLLGRVLVGKIQFFRTFCIPAPVVGGLLFALVHLATVQTGLLRIFFEFEDGKTPTLQTIFMTIFFCSVGFTACFRLLKKGGGQIFVFLALSIVMVLLQNGVGAGLAKLFDWDPKLGLAVGSIPLVGGHGTAGSYGPLLENDYGIVGANAVAIAAATYGLVSGGLIGGPIARSLVKKYNLHSTAVVEGIEAEEVRTAIDDERFMNASLLLAVAIGIGTLVYLAFKSIGFALPTYIGAMLIAATIRNIADAGQKDLPMREIETIGNLSLNLFLAMAMMTLRLWELAALAIPMIAILLTQTLVMALYARFLVFNFIGKDYEAAAMTTAFCGFGMGATPNAMANMKALVELYGPAPRTFFIVPLVGSLFIDFFNGTILTLLVNIL